MACTRFAAFCTILVVAAPLAAQRATRAQRELGEHLFAETALGNPGSSFQAACDTCHKSGKDPRGRGELYYSDGEEVSLLPAAGSRAQDTTLRNTPALADLELGSRFGRDGRYASLEELLQDKLVSSHIGWKAADRERAIDLLQTNLLNEPNSDYEQLFRAAYRLDIEELSPQGVYEATAIALANYLRLIRSELTSGWDAFADMNRIPIGPARDEAPKHYAGRIAGRISNQEGRVLIKRPMGFGQDAYEGFKTFFRVDGDASVGNCVSCHVPPSFTDNLFHNTGISQADYDSRHGDGAFNELEVPGPDTTRPRPSLLANPSSGDHNLADLGYWNWVDPATAPERGEGEGAADLLERLVGAFRTPSLRNLPRTRPYMHNGAYDSIEDAVTEIVRINQLARDGKLRSISPEYEVMKLSPGDIPHLTAFLESMDEVDADTFRELLLNFESD